MRGSWVSGGLTPVHLVLAFVHHITIFFFRFLQGCIQTCQESLWQTEEQTEGYLY